MRSEQYFAGDVDVILSDGSRVSAKVTADEFLRDGKEVYQISFQQGAGARVAKSERDFFEALKGLRLELEKTGALLYCFGASRNVYPSGMQRSMGPAILACRTQIGSPTSLQGIVNIFEADETVDPSTVDQQERSHERWIQSLSGS